MRVALLLDPVTSVLDDPFSLRIRWAAHASRLARELIGRGHAVRGFGAPPGVIPRSSDEEDADVVGGKLRQFRPDVILAYDALSTAALRGARLARSCNASLVLLEAALPPEGHALRRGLQRVGEWLWGPYVRRRADVLVALDSTAREQALREGFAPEKVRIIPHGVDLQRWRPGLSSPLVSRHKIRGRTLVYVGRLALNRGLDVLINAFARTVGQRNDWSLVLSGDGNARPELRAMADRLGVGERIHWLPYPRKEELPGLLNAATGLVVPWRDERVVGKVVGRALACGTPILASDIPRLRAMVEDQETGLMAPPGDIELWTELIQRFASSPVARERWSRNARAFAEEHLGWAVVAEEFEELFLAARGGKNGALSVSARPLEDGHIRPTPIEPMADASSTSMSEGVG